MRAAGRSRIVAALGLFAILLLACAPTISQLRAAAASRDHHSHASMLAGEEMPQHEGMRHRHEGTPPDDCWKKCGYCDFLTHAPAIGSVPYVAPISAASAPILAARALVPRAHTAYFPAARPRGPPSDLV